MRKVTPYLVLGGALLVGALALHANTHTDHCRPVPEGTQCEIVWGAK